MTTTYKINNNTVAIIFFEMRENYTRWVFKNKYVDEKEDIVFDPLSAKIMWLISNQSSLLGWKEITISTRELSNKSRGTTNGVNTRLRKLASRGLITVENGWKLDGSKKRQTNKFKVNPLLRDMLLDPKLVKITARKQIYNELTELWDTRCHTKKCFQGFGDSWPYGEVKTEENTVKCEVVENSKLDDSLDRIKKEKSKQDLKKKNDAYWRKLSESFVVGSGQLWTAIQKERGEITAQPSWSMTKNLTASARSEAYELVNLFKSYGGATTAVAWYVFTASEKIYKDGKLDFKPDMGFVQYTGIDKSPKKFSQYFEQVIATRAFKEFCTTRWDNEVRPYLDKIYGQALYSLPKDGSQVKNRIGFNFGIQSLDEVF